MNAVKLYDFGPAANSKRVRMFLVEKGIEIPIVELNVRDNDQFKEPFTSMNPFHCVPFLELDDGTVIAESISICRYIEEMHPEPSLFGRDPVERATIRPTTETPTTTSNPKKAAILVVASP